VPSDPKGKPKWSQGTPKSEPRPPKLLKKNRFDPFWTTVVKKNGSVLLEPHYLLCF
jgi:hypothetical protein